MSSLLRVRFTLWRRRRLSRSPATQPRKVARLRIGSTRSRRSDSADRRAPEQLDPHRSSAPVRGRLAKSWRSPRLQAIACLASLWATRCHASAELTHALSNRPELLQQLGRAREPRLLLRIQAHCLAQELLGLGPLAAVLVELLRPRPVREALDVVRHELGVGLDAPKELFKIDPSPPALAPKEPRQVLRNAAAEVPRQIRRCRDMRRPSSCRCRSLSATSFEGQSRSKRRPPILGRLDMGQ